MKVSDEDVLNSRKVSDRSFRKSDFQKIESL